MAGGGIAGNGGTDTTAVTITVTDVNEPLEPPMNPRTRGGGQPVTLSWTAPVAEGVCLPGLSLNKGLHPLLLMGVLFLGGLIR